MAFSSMTGHETLQFLWKVDLIAMAWRHRAMNKKQQKKSKMYFCISFISLPTFKELLIFMTDYSSRIWFFLLFSLNRPSVVFYFSNKDALGSNSFSLSADVNHLTEIFVGKSGRAESYLFPKRIVFRFRKGGLRTSILLKHARGTGVTWFLVQRHFLPVVLICFLFSSIFFTSCNLLLFLKI